MYNSWNFWAAAEEKKEDKAALVSFHIKSKMEEKA